MKIYFQFIVSLFILSINREVDSLNLSPDFLFGSIRNATLDATNYLSNSIKKQTDIVMQAKNTAADYVSNAVNVQRNMLIRATNATRNYIDGAASRGMELKFRTVAEIFRVEMHHGIPSLDIPILEPFEIVHAEYDLTNKEIGNLSIVLDNVTISGLSTFVLNDVKISVIDGLNIAINISVPIINAQGLYRVNGMVGGMFPVNGKGPFDIEIEGSNCQLKTDLGYSGKMYAKKLSINFSILSSRGKFSHLYNDRKTDDTINKVILTMGPEFLEAVKPELIPKIEEILLERLNTSIGDLTMTNIIGILTGTVHLQDFLNLVNEKRLLSFG